MHFQIDIGQHGCILVLGVAQPGQALDAEYDFADGGSLSTGEKSIHFAANDEPDNALDGGVSDCSAAD